MTRYPVHVTLPPDTTRQQVVDQIDQRMAPFCEDLAVPAYRQYRHETSPTTHWAWEAITGKPRDAQHDMGWETFTSLYNARFPDDRTLHYDPDKNAVYHLSTQNPLGKWDYWMIGGAYADFWSATPNALESECLTSRSTGHDTRGRVAGGRKSNLDLAGALDRATRKAREGHRLYTRLLDGCSPLQTPQEIREEEMKRYPGIANACEPEEGALEQRVHARYIRQEELTKIAEYERSTGTRVFLHQLVHAQRTSEEEWVAQTLRQKGEGITAYAHIDLNGEWCSPSDQSPFDVLSGHHEADALRYDQEAARYLMDLDDQAWIITLEVHL